MDIRIQSYQLLKFKTEISNKTIKTSFELGVEIRKMQTNFVRVLTNDRSPKL